METPQGPGKSRFEQRSEEALARRKNPTESDEVIHLPDLNKVTTPVVLEESLPASNESTEHAATKLRYEAGAQGFLIVAEDGTKRKPTEAEEDQIIRTEMGDSLRPDVPPMENIRISEEELAALESGAAVTPGSPETAAQTPATLDDRKMSLRERLEAVKAKVGEKHLGRLSQFIDGISNDDELRGMDQALRVYEGGRKRERTPKAKPPEKAEEKREEPVRTEGPRIQNDEELRGLLKRLALKTIKNTSLFQVHMSGDRMTGGPGYDEQPYFTHPEAPDVKFTQEEIEQEAARRKQTRKPTATPRPSAGTDYLSSDLLIAHKAPRAWTLDRANYIGVDVKRIPEILSSPRDAQFFGEMLRAMDARRGDVLVRFHEGELTQEDMDFLTYGAHEYSKWMQEGERVAASVTADDVELIGKRNPDMQNFIAFLPRGRELESLKELILHMAMRSPAQLQDLSDSLKELKRARETGRFKRYEAKIDDQAERLGIARKDYGAMFDLKNAKRRRATEARLAKHIHEQAGSFRRAIDWVEGITRSPMSIPGSSYYKAIVETREASRITPHQKSILSPRSWVLDTINNNLSVLTDHLSATVADPEIRRAVVREALTNQSQARAGSEGPRTYAEVQAKANENSSKELKSRISAHLEAYPNFKSMPSYQQDAILSDFKETERERQEKGTGFFAWLSSMLFANNFDKAASDVAGRTVRYA